MKVTAAEIIERIKDLPKGFEEMVHKKGPGLAEVESFSDPSHGSYTVAIRPHKTDSGDKSILDVTCTCPATKLCHHITAFYAVAKELVPTKSIPEGGEAKEEGLAMISQGIEMVVNGIALAIREQIEKEE